MMAYEFTDLSNAFYRTGNESLGSEMSILAETLKESEKNISGAVSREINRSFNSAQDATNSMMALTLKSCLPEKG